MAVRFDFECQKAHTFTIWSDEARCCPVCGSEFLKRVFLDPPMVNTQKSKIVDSMVRNQLESMGITNIQGGGHEGDREKVTYKTTPEQLAAQKIEKDFPQMNDPQGLVKAKEQIMTKWSSIGVKGVIKSGLGTVPEQEFTKAAIVGAGSHDRQLVNRMYRKDPQNLQVPQVKK